MDQQGHRVLIRAPFGRDADSIASLLKRERYDACVCASLAILADKLDEDTGAVVVTEEALLEGLPELQRVLQTQAPWSDIPVVLLSARKVGPSSTSKVALQRVSDISANLILIERPLSSISLLSAVASALRSRQKQFEMRESLRQIEHNTKELVRRNAELAQSQHALRESEAKFLAITNSIDQMVWSSHPDGSHDYYNQRWYDYTHDTGAAGWDSFCHPEDCDRVARAWAASLAAGNAFQLEFRLKHNSGGYRWVLGRAQAIRGSDDSILRWYGTFTEIQQIVEARDVLARSREELEQLVQARTADLEQANDLLRQSQKMEAVGQLTGGIAHDFNNMLTGVIGSLSIIKRRLDENRVDDLDRFISAATTSAQRAASLTQRLLAFSRRQTLDPRPLDANSMLQSLSDLIERTISEQIVLQLKLSDDLPPCVADGNQLESAILNLVINARDAMPDGGTLTLSTHGGTSAAVQDSAYVTLAISDTGVGMPREVLERAFDPFFTTKPLGQGTGLGLSMVYGFIRQSGGDVRIESRPGHGTTVSLLLPVATQKVVKSASALIDVPPGRGQSILIVEDDPSVRMLIGDVLKEMGYRYTEAEDAFDAVQVLASQTQLDLLISDVGLPGMNGRQLAEVARIHRPSLPILFVTGYAENAAIRAEFLGKNMGMISKPFSLEELATKVAHHLSGSTAVTS